MKVTLDHHILVFILIIGALIFLLFAPAESIPPEQESGGSTNELPNILLIRTDDQDYRSMETKLPNGDFVIKNVRETIMQPGTRFTRSFVSFPLCCPSRATTLTGQLPHNHKVLSNGLPYGGHTKLNHSNTLPMWLQDEGYYTMHVGKYLNGYNVAQSQQGLPHPPPGWNKWYTLIGDIHAYYNYKIYDGQQILQFGTGSGYYQTDVLTRKTLEYLYKRPYGNRPFFLQLDYIAPHADGDSGSVLATPADRHLGMMDNASLPMPPSFNEADVSDKPLNIRSLPLMSAQDIALTTNVYRRRMESLLAVDEGVKKIIEMLEQTNQLNKTIIIFTSDNGYLHGEHRVKHGKFLPYEPLQVPLFIRGPGIPQGKVIHQLVVNTDYAATIAEWAGATLHLPQDGRSLVPLINGITSGWRTDLLFENPKINNYVGLRTKNPNNGREYIYTEYDYNEDNITDEKELYALTADECRQIGDPYQLESQHNNSCYTNLIQQFHQRLAVLKNCIGAACH